MKLLTLTLMFSFLSISANKCSQPTFNRGHYTCELINFKTDAVFDTLASHVSGRLFSRDGTPIQGFSVVFTPEEVKYPSDTVYVNEKGKFGKWLSTNENTFFIHVLKKNKKVATLPEQRINGGTAYWADIQVKKEE